MTLKDTPKPISSQAADSGPLQLDLQGGQTTSLSGPPRARASHSASRVKAEESMIQGTCGRTYFESSEARKLPGSDRLTLWENRLADRLAMVGSTESALIWRKKVTPAGHAIYRLAPSTRHINGTDCSGALWTTVADVMGGRKSRSGKRRGEPLLNGLMAAYSPTPVIFGNYNRAGASENSGNGLATVMRETAPSGLITNGSLARSTEKRGVPNPLFPFWLMGFPTEWVYGALRAAQSFRKSRRKF